MVSWKGDIKKSGGVVNNIGIHFFDALSWIFGKVRTSIVHISEPTRAAGFLELDSARIRWFLSIDRNDLPFSEKPDNQMTYRSIKIDKEEIEFSGGFTDLHIES